MAMTLITTNTSSDAASSSFTSSIDNTYKLYIFRWHNINGSANDASFQFNGTLIKQVNPVIMTAFTNDGKSVFAGLTNGQVHKWNLMENAHLPKAFSWKMTGKLSFANSFSWKMTGK